MTHLSRLWNIFRITWLEQRRSPWDLLMVLLLAPAFLYMYWAFMGGGSTSYKVLVINSDRDPCPVGGAGQSCAEQAIQRMSQLTYRGGTPILRLTLLEERSEAEKRLRDRTAAALVIFPEEFSRAISAARLGQPPPEASVVLVGDLANPYYSVAAIMTSATLEDYLRQVTNQPRPVQISEQPLGGSGSRSEFEMYVPGLLIAAVTMMIFSVTIAVTRQIESGTVRRLQLTRMTAFDFLGGISLMYLWIALLSVALSILTAQALGFRSQGPLWLAWLIYVLTALASIGAGLITACFSGTAARAAIIANFPLMLLLFFSGAVFPLPQVRLFTIAGRTIGLFDLLPHTHAVTALNKVLSLGSGVSEIGFELAALAVLCVAYFAAGVWLFQRMHMRAR